MEESEGLPGERPRRRASVKERERALIIAVLVTVTSAAVFVFIVSFSQGPESGYDERYQVTVKAVDTDEYLIRLPVPVNEVGHMPPYFMGGLEVIVGEPVFALAEYEHGMGLEIRSRGYLELEWSMELSESWASDFGNLTMTTGAEGYSYSENALAWIFSDSSDIEIVFSYSSIYHHISRNWVSGGGPTFEFDEHPDGTGWQSIPIAYGWMVIN